MNRLTLAVLAVALTGCSNLGLEGNIPLAEAEQMPPAELVAAVHARPANAGETVVMEGRLWVPWGPPTELDPGTLRPVGSVHGTTVYAWSWDRPPLDALFTARGSEWQAHAPVLGGSGSRPTEDP